MKSGCYVHAQFKFRNLFCLLMLIEYAYRFLANIIVTAIKDCPGNSWNSLFSDSSEVFIPFGPSSTVELNFCPVYMYFFVHLFLHFLNTLITHKQKKRTTSGEEYFSIFSLIWLGFLTCSI